MNVRVELLFDLGFHFLPLLMVINIESHLSLKVPQYVSLSVLILDFLNYSKFKERFQSHLIHHCPLRELNKIIL